jgi:hypothetical protein
VGAGIVLHQHDLARVEEVFVRQRLEELRVIERGVATGANYARDVGAGGLAVMGW